MPAPPFQEGRPPCRPNFSCCLADEQNSRHKVINKRPIRKRLRLRVSSGRGGQVSRYPNVSFTKKLLKFLPIHRIVYRTVSSQREKILEISDTSAAAIREYLGEGTRDPNLENENGTTHEPFLNQSLWACQSPIEVPGDLKQGGRHHKLKTELNRLLHECTNTYIEQGLGRKGLTHRVRTCRRSQ
jgi:hypothetical protein